MTLNGLYCPDVPLSNYSLTLILNCITVVRATIKVNRKHQILGTRSPLTHPLSN